jgi:molecular chaperone DnaK (HSP70)
MDKDGEVNPISADATHQTFPFLVSFSKNGITFANQAKNTIVNNCETTIEGIRQLIGRGYDDIYVTDLLQRVYFKISKNSVNLPVVSVSLKDKTYEYSPESVLAILFYQIKYILEKRSNEKVIKLSIVVPEYYTRRQMKIVRTCAELVGIKVLSVQYEAEMFACSVYSFYHTEMTFCYCSYSHDSFNISKVSITEKTQGGKTVPHIQTVKSVSKLCSNKLDRILLNYLLDVLQKNRVNIEGNARQEVALRLIVDEAIMNLKSKKTVEIDLSQFVPGLIEKFKRDKFETIADICIDEVINIASNFEFGDVQYFAFMGDLPDYPFLINSIKDCLTEDAKEIDIPNMKTSCAIGAALYNKGNFTIVPTLHHNIVIPGSKKTTVYTVIEGNSILPNSGSHQLSSVSTGVSNMSIPIYEGDLKKRKYYSKIGSFSFTQELTEENKQFEFKIFANKDGDLNCSASGKGYKFDGPMTDIVSFSVSDVVQSINDSKGIIQIANLIAEDIDKLLDYCNEYKSIINKSKFDKSVKEKTISKIKEIEEWCKQITDSFPSQEIRDEIKEKVCELEMIDITKFINIEF